MSGGPGNGRFATLILLKSSLFFLAKSYLSNKMYHHQGSFFKILYYVIKCVYCRHPTAKSTTFCMLRFKLSWPVYSLTTGMVIDLVWEGSQSKYTLIDWFQNIKMDMRWVLVLIFFFFLKLIGTVICELWRVWVFIKTFLNFRSKSNELMYVGSLRIQF